MSNNIESILTESRVFEPSAAMQASVAVNAEKLAQLYAKAEQDHVGFWADLAHEKLTWSKPFTQALDESRAPLYRWFTDGELNVSYNCIDRHLDEKSDKLAIIFEGDKGDVHHYTYQELHDEVCRFANTLTTQGIKQGDRVII